MNKIKQIFSVASVIILIVGSIGMFITARDYPKRYALEGQNKELLARVFSLTQDNADYREKLAKCTSINFNDKIKGKKSDIVIENKIEQTNNSFPQIIKSFFKDSVVVDSELVAKDYIKKLSKSDKRKLLK